MNSIMQLLATTTGQPNLSDGPNPAWFVGGALVLIILFLGLYLMTRYRRCPANRILVVSGKVGSQRAAKCFHGGGAFVLPLIQEYAYLGLEPMVIDIPLEGALSLNNIRVKRPLNIHRWYLDRRDPYEQRGRAPAQPQLQANP